MIERFLTFLEELFCLHDYDFSHNLQGPDQITNCTSLWKCLHCKKEKVFKGAYYGCK